MKKWVPYIVGGIALSVLILLVMNTPLKRPRKLEERISMRQRDKIPYGTYVAHQLLTTTFSKAHVTFDKAAPGYWAGVNMDISNQVVFLISFNFDPGYDELKTISRFIKKGNTVFIVTQNIGWDASRYLNLETEKQFYNLREDSLQITLNEPLATAAAYIYPGKRYDSYFTDVDSAKAFRLGNDAEGHANFIQLKAGAGKLFIHLAPLAFSNYFILHKSNFHYFENLLSIIPEPVNNIVWNEYFLTQHTKKEPEPNILSVLWQHQPFRWALIVASATLLLYVLSAMRRHQRIIPFFAKPANDSLDFVRTMGRLYYDRKDHHNLSKKMAAYFLEHVRSRYKIVNPEVDESFTDELHAKSNYTHEELKKITASIQYINTYTIITEQELARFYQQLHLFYKNTDGTIV